MVVLQLNFFQHFFVILENLLDFVLNILFVFDLVLLDLPLAEMDELSLLLEEIVRDLELLLKLFQIFFVFFGEVFDLLAMILFLRLDLIFE